MTVDHSRSHLIRADATKRCAGCKQNKPVENFPRNRSTASGYGWRCTPCAVKANRKYLMLED